MPHSLAEVVASQEQTKAATFMLPTTIPVRSTARTLKSRQARPFHFLIANNSVENSFALSPQLTLQPAPRASRTECCLAEG